MECQVLDPHVSESLSQKVLHVILITNLKIYLKLIIFGFGLEEFLENQKEN